MKIILSICRFAFNIVMFVVLPWTAVYYSQFYVHPYAQNILFLFVLCGWGYGLFAAFDSYVKRTDSEELDVVEQYRMKKGDRIMMNLFVLIVGGGGILFVLFSWIVQIPYALGILFVIPLSVIQMFVKYWWQFLIFIVICLIVKLINGRLEK